MKLGLISDTHDDTKAAEAAVNFFESQQVDKVVHCGDMIAPFTAEIFDGDFDFCCVKGNNDGEWNLKQVVNDFGRFYNNIAELKIRDSEIAVYHGTEEEIVKGLVNQSYDYVFRGHTHKRKLEEHDGTTEVNPGGIKLPNQNEEFSIAILDFEDGEIEFYKRGEIT